MPCAPGKRERGHRGASADKQGEKDSLSAGAFLETCSSCCLLGPVHPCRAPLLCLFIALRSNTHIAGEMQAMGQG